MHTTFLLWKLIGKFSCLFCLLAIVSYILFGQAERMAVARMRERRYKDAIFYLNVTLSIAILLDWLFPAWKKQHALIRYHRAYCYMKQEEYKLAQADFTKAIALDPKSVTAYMYRGQSFFVLGKLEEALLDLNIAVDLLLRDPHPELEPTELKKAGKIVPLIHRAMVHKQMGHEDLAEKDYELCKQLVPELQII